MNTFLGSLHLDFAAIDGLASCCRLKRSEPLNLKSWLRQAGTLLSRVPAPTVCRSVSTYSNNWLNYGLSYVYNCRFKRLGFQGAGLGLPAAAAAGIVDSGEG